MPAGRVGQAAEWGIYPGTRKGYSLSMPTTSKERDVIVERLADINADPNSNPGNPSPEQTSEGAKLDKETTKLLRKLADDDPAKPAAG
jgi:hypothetical protein